MWLSWIQYHIHILINKRVHPHGFWLSRPQKGSRFSRKQINTVTLLHPRPFRKHMIDETPSCRLQITPQSSYRKKHFCKGKCGHKPYWKWLQPCWCRNTSYPARQRQDLWMVPGLARTKTFPYLCSSNAEYQHQIQKALLESKMQRWVINAEEREPELAKEGCCTLIPLLYSLDHTTDTGKGSQYL